ncbi:hypothetical protein BDW59DRAFT_166287 [Aspergillus cavernicola]|uniref:Carrier domain-containing protein n=1 Tax=Aspergillus cavernicola TaxID=176166 RepID=A0ABR4HPL1_9EURO
MDPGPENHAIFPHFGSGVMEDGRICVQEIATSSAFEIRKFCQEYDISGHSFYLTVWSLVLRAFAETDSVCIGFGDFRTGCAELNDAPLKNLHSTLSPRRPVSQILEEFKDAEREASLNTQETHRNTAVVLLPKAIDPLELWWLTKLNYSIFLTVSFRDSTNLLAKLSMVYLSSSLPPSHAGNLSSNITQAMQQVVAHYNGYIKDIDLFSPLNTRTVSRWNATAQKAASLLEVIRGHAKCRPDHPAIYAWDGTVSYSELEILTAQWASYLQSQGVKPECLDPIMMDHSKWAIIGEIAILKAGGAFVPLDPAAPVSRLEDIVQQTNARISVSSPHLVDKLQDLVNTVIPISDERTSSFQSPPNTGRPKGCVVNYGALSDVVNQTMALKIGPESRVLHFASYTYGMSLIEIYCSLAAGATICVPLEDDGLNALSSVLQSMQITWAILTPSTTLSITESLGCLETLVVAGEALTLDHFYSLADKVELIQAFGLTEWGGICCVSQKISSESDLRIIGRSPTARLWLADPTDDNKLAPVGAVAELLVEGPALADCYLGNPHQTAAAFLKDPLWRLSSTGARFYKTGDLVQYTANGNLRYISRKDNQVKIRGMRVELAEVEYQIRQAYPVLENAIVEAAAAKNSNGMPILAAFLYSGKAQIHQDSPFCTYVYIPLPSIPLTISRKVDRKTLRHLLQSSTREELERYQSPTASIVAPQTDIERQLHQLVAEVLHLELLSFGMGQNFITLGGDSVTAMLLVNRCKKHGYMVTFAAILRAQSISDIASLLHIPSTSAGAKNPSQKNTAVESQSDICPASAGYVPIPRLSHSGPVEQSSSQARIWFLQTLHPESTWLLLPSATRLQGSLQVDALETALSALAERHETLQTTFESRNGFGVQLVAPFRPKRLKVVEICSDSNAELMTALHGQQMTPMDITKECWRVALFRLLPKDHVLSIVLHRIICDGWSFDILMKTLEAYYAAAIRDQPC